ncbi:MAG: ArdC-like ssDNA-binding domain-containing protein [Dehalococcoidales bacterium]|nr:ArdC-like ssDNA-binding domain-containing protein [Dehalococcoidales bacterium]
MAGQVVVTIDNNEWYMDVATLPWELSQGLGGLVEIPTATGMLFDLGIEQTIEVTTVPMLFPLDIAFLSQDMTITEIYRNIEPGYIVTSQLPAKYFLEVNAGELTDIEAGIPVAVEYLATEVVAPAESDLVSAVVPFVGFLAVGTITTLVMRDIVKGLFDDEKSYLIQQANDASAECEIVRPQHYDIISWVGAPLPDYSFTIEPEVKERKIDEVLKRLKEGVSDIQESDNFKQFLLTMSKFHDYSIGNLILITIQKPEATRVAGFKTWRDLGRWVKKGEKGIAILAPCFPPKEKKTETEKAEEEEAEIEVSPVYFKVVHVFDVSQTDGEPLPEFEVPSLTGEANEELFEKTMALTSMQGLDVSFESRPYQDPAIKGTYSGKSIWVKPEESRAQQLKTLLHEVAHYYTESVFRIPRRDAETIAESVAFTIGAHFGFDSGIRSFSYVALWAEDRKVLEVNLTAIRKVSTKIFDALESTRIGVTIKR